MTVQPLVESPFAVPDGYVADGLRLELLGPHHNEADHAAWTASIEHIRSTPGFDRGWPLDGPLTEVVGAWLREAWPFEVVRYRSGERPLTIRKGGSRADRSGR